MSIRCRTACRQDRTACRQDRTACRQDRTACRQDRPACRQDRYSGQQSCVSGQQSRLPGRQPGGLREMRRQTRDARRGTNNRRNEAQRHDGVPRVVATSARVECRAQRAVATSARAAHGVTADAGNLVPVHADRMRPGGEHASQHRHGKRDAGTGFRLRTSDFRIGMRCFFPMSEV